MDSWKGCFLKKLQDVQSKCAQKFEDVLERAIVPVYSDLSTFLADAAIEYTGEGVLASAEKPGLITRLMNWIF